MFKYFSDTLFVQINKVNYYVMSIYSADIFDLTSFPNPYLRKKTNRKCWKKNKPRFGGI